MDLKIFLAILWLTTVYQTKCATSRGKPKRNGLSEVEPRPYTISFFTFPGGAASELLKSKTSAQRPKPATPGNVSVNLRDEVGHKANESSTPDNSTVETPKAFAKNATKRKQISGAKHAQKKTKHHRPFVQVYEKPNAIDKAGLAPDAGPEKGRQKAQETWNLGASHNKIEFKEHQMQTDEAFQEGSINHPSHTMYPECHHCPSNSTHYECVRKSTLTKCDKGLENICFTKSFYSRTRGVIYEMGCSNHVKCKKAKAAPCKGNQKKCFVCCQFNGCNAVPHFYQTPTADASSEDSEIFSVGQASTCAPSTWILFSLLIIARLII